MRRTARAIIVEDGYLYVVKRITKKWGTYYSIPGGGIEEGETPEMAVIREVKEELGYSIKDIKLIGSILDCYNLINRITYSTFFHCYIDEDIKLESNRTDEEQSLIKEVLWLDPLEALDWLENKSMNKCDKLVHARDKLALRYYLQNYTSIL